MVFEDPNSIVSPLLYPVNVITSIHTATTPPDIGSATPDFTFTVPATGIKLNSLSLAFDTTFQTYYSYIVVIDSVEMYNNKFERPSQAANTYEYVPSNRNIPLRGGSQIRVWSYNSNSATVDGTYSVSLLGDKQVF